MIYCLYLTKISAIAHLPRKTSVLVWAVLLCCCY